MFVFFPDSFLTLGRYLDVLISLTGFLTFANVLIASGVLVRCGESPTGASGHSVVSGVPGGTPGCETAKAV